MKIEDIESIHLIEECPACNRIKETTIIVCNKCFNSWFHENNGSIPNYLISVIQRKFYIVQACIKNNEQHRH